MPNRVSVISLIAVVLSTLTLSVAPLAGASVTSGRISIDIPFSLGPASPVITVCDMHAPKGTTAKVQGLQSGKWVTLYSLPLAGTRCATHTQSESKVGLYKFRCQLLRGARAISACGQTSFAVLERVSLATLCNHERAAFDRGTSYLINDCSPVAVPLPGGPFTALFCVGVACASGNGPMSVPPDVDVLIQYGSHTSCRALTISGRTTGTGGPVALAFEQNRPPQPALVMEVPAQAVKNFKIDGVSWSLEAWGSSGAENVYVNGSAWCWNKSGVN